jgi:hypothetical protein
MAPIFEKDLVLAGQNKAIENLRIQQLESGKYSVIVKLTWRADEVVQVTQKKRVRCWANLDRLLDHIRNNYGITSEINVTLKGEAK